MFTFFLLIPVSEAKGEEFSQLLSDISTAFPFLASRISFSDVTVDWATAGTRLWLLCGKKPGKVSAKLPGKSSRVGWLKKLSLKKGMKLWQFEFELSRRLNWFICSMFGSVSGEKIEGLKLWNSCAKLAMAGLWKIDEEPKFVWIMRMESCVIYL